MADLRSSLVRGFLVGVAGVAVLAAARRLGRGADSALIDWGLARSFAERVGGVDGRLPNDRKARLLVDYQAMVQALEAPLERYTGTSLPLADLAIEVMDRPDWIRANTANFEQLLEPVEQAYRRNLLQSGGAALALAPATRAVLSGQIGLLLGYLSRRVLGQYDVSLLGREPVSAGKLYFVEPNIRALEQRLRLPASELRQWIVLHEATHAHEFEVYPWVRGYLNDQLRQYLSTVIEDMLDGGKGVPGALVARLAENLRQGHNLLNALMTPRQREIIARLQALMSLAEGYSNHVMNAVGRQLLPHFEDIARSFERRQRERGLAEDLFLRITGLSMKFEQYRLGEAFVDRVVAARGVAFLNRAWRDPESLPSDAELRRPEAWIARIEARAAA